MRLWLILLVGLLTFALTACPAPEDEYEGDQTSMDDEGQKRPDAFSEDEAVADEAVADEAVEATDEGMAEGDEMAAGAYCAKCGMEGCDGTCEGEGGFCTHCGVQGCDGSCMAPAEEAVEDEAGEDEHAGHDHDAEGDEAEEEGEA